MKLFLWFKTWSLSRQLDSMYLARRVCREDLADLALSIVDAEHEYATAKREYFGVMA